ADSAPRRLLGTLRDRDRRGDGVLRAGAGVPADERSRDRPWRHEARCSFPPALTRATRASVHPALDREDTVHAAGHRPRHGAHRPRARRAGRRRAMDVLSAADIHTIAQRATSFMTERAIPFHRGDALDYIGYIATVNSKLTLPIVPSECEFD